MGFSRQGYGVGCRFLLQGIFPTQRSNLGLFCLLHWYVGSWILTASATWEPHKCTNATRPPGLFLKQLRSHFLPYHFHAQHSSSGPTSGVCTRNPLPLLTLRIECSASLSSWNLAEPKASQKAVLFLPVGSVQLPLDSACSEGSEWGPGACWDSVPAALGGLLRTIKEAW